MDRSRRMVLALFAPLIVDLGVLGLVVGDFALQWQPVPASVPGRTVLAYACAALMAACGVALLIERTTPVASRVLFAYLVLWVLLLKVPPVLREPQLEANWLGLGEITVLCTGCWVLFAEFGSGHRDANVRVATIVFGLALLPIGLSHIVYVKETTALVPSYLPLRTVLAYLTGAAQIACGLAVLVPATRRIGAMGEATLVSLFTVLVWLPQVIAHPNMRLPWTALLISASIAGAAWVVGAVQPRLAGS